MWLQLKTVTPHANQPEQLHAALSLSLSVSTRRGRFHCRSLHPSQPTRAGFSRCKPARETDGQTEAETETWQTAKKRIHYFSFNCFFHTFKIFSASRSHKPSLSNFSSSPPPTGSAFCMFRPHLSQTNNCLQEIQLCLLITDATSWGKFLTRTKRMLQAVSKFFKENC